MFNSQFSILIRKEKRPRHPLPMRIEHWEFSIGQIPVGYRAADSAKLFLREP